MTATHTMCRRCVMDTEVPGVRLDGNGICNHCRIHDKLDQLYPTGDQGRREMEQIADQVRKAGKGRDYDCVVGVSGGRDTSYCLYMTKQLGLRPLAVHFDNGWDSDTAKSNLSKVCRKLNVDLHSVIADWEESRELTNCTIRACVPYIDLTDDVGIARALYDSAVQEGVRYIMLSHSYREEGITPLKWNYMDGRYVRSLIRQFSRIPLTKFRNVDLHHMFYWHIMKRIKVVNITNYYNDAGKHVEQLLADEFGWIDTHQHHYDNEIFALVFHYARRKFGIDWRVFEFAAKVRTGVLTREEATEALRISPPFETEENIAYCLKKQGIPHDEWEAIIAAPNKYFTDYPNYYTFLNLLRWPIKLLGRMNFLPAYSYEKYFET